MNNKTISVLEWINLSLFMWCILFLFMSNNIEMFMLSGITAVICYFNNTLFKQVK